MKLRCILLLIALPSAIFAQSNYHAGYVLKNNGDTLKGYIDYREWTQNPKSINFKGSSDDKQVQHFNPLAIKKFEINGMETYVSYLGLISTNATRFSSTPSSLDTGKKTDTIFLKQLVTGNHVTLFCHEDEVKTRFFIAETNAGPVELKYYSYYNNVNQVAELAVYKGQLQLYVNKFTPGNQKLSNEADRARYEQTDLEHLADELNNNNANLRKKAPLRLFAGIGVNRTVTEVRNFQGSNPAQYSTTISPKISAGVDIFDNPNTQRLVFRAEVSFFYAAPRFKRPVVVGNENTYDVYSFNQYTAAITPQILINIYNKDNLKFYIDGGVAFNLSAYANNKFTTLSSDANVVNAYTVQNPYDLASFWSNFPVQIGVVLNKRTEISLTYIGYTAYTKYSSFSAANQTWGLGVKFLLGK